MQTIKINIHTHGNQNTMLVYVPSRSDSLYIYSSIRAFTLLLCIVQRHFLCCHFVPSTFFACIFFYACNVYFWFIIIIFFSSISEIILMCTLRQTLNCLWTNTITLYIVDASHSKTLKPKGKTFCPLKV